MNSVYIKRDKKILGPFRLEQCHAWLQNGKFIQSDEFSNNQVDWYSIKVLPVSHLTETSLSSDFLSNASSSAPLLRATTSGKLALNTIPPPLGGNGTKHNERNNSVAVDGIVKNPVSIFVSYANQDLDLAETIVDSLEKGPFVCWYAKRNILPGANWANAIMLGIEQCEIMLLIYSQHSDMSVQVLREVERAVSKKKLLLPLKTAEFKPNAAMEYYIASTHWLDISETNLRAALPELAKMLHELRQGNKLTASLKLQNRTRRTFLKSSALAVAGFVTGFGSKAILDPAIVPVVTPPELTAIENKAKYCADFLSSTKEDETQTTTNIPDKHGKTLNLVCNTKKHFKLIEHLTADPARHGLRTDSVNELCRGNGTVIGLLLKILHEEVSFNLNQNMLEDVVEQIQVEKRIPVIIDKQSLEENAFDTSTPIDCVINNTILSAAIDHVLGQLDLGFYLDQKGLVICSKIKAKEKLIALNYAFPQLK